jgi:hypothetical protein
MFKTPFTFTQIVYKSTGLMPENEMHFQLTHSKPIFLWKGREHKLAFF